MYMRAHRGRMSSAVRADSRPFPSMHDAPVIDGRRHAYQPPPGEVTTRGYLLWFVRSSDARLRTVPMPAGASQGRISNASQCAGRTA